MVQSGLAIWWVEKGPKSQNFNMPTVINSNMELTEPMVFLRNSTNRVTGMPREKNLWKLSIDIYEWPEIMWNRAASEDGGWKNYVKTKSRQGLWEWWPKKIPTAMGGQRNCVKTRFQKATVFYYVKVPWKYGFVSQRDRWKCVELKSRWFHKKIRTFEPKKLVRIRGVAKMIILLKDYVKWTNRMAGRFLWAKILKLSIWKAPKIDRLMWSETLFPGNEVTTFCEINALGEWQKDF